MKTKELAIATLLSLMAGASQAQTVNLTGLAWEVTGHDGLSWNGSDLFFTSQTPTASGYDLTGYFDWYNNGTFRGRELFTGSLTPSLDLHVVGYQLVNPVGIVLSTYDGDVTPNGLEVINGTWTTQLGRSGVWAAVVVPEPSSIMLLGFGLAGVVLVARRKLRTKA